MVLKQEDQLEHIISKLDVMAIKLDCLPSLTSDVKAIKLDMTNFQSVAEEILENIEEFDSLMMRSRRGCQRWSCQWFLLQIIRPSWA